MSFEKKKNFFDLIDKCYKVNESLYMLYIFFCQITIYLKKKCDFIKKKVKITILLRKV